MAYPIADELAAWMVAQRLLAAVPEDLTALETALLAAIAGWEGDTYWTPFLAEAGTRRFDGPQGYRLFPPVGILSLSSLTVGGTALTEDDDYVLMDPKLGRYAYQSIEFTGWVAGGRRLVVATGVFGCATELPADARLAILSKAAAGISTDSTSTGALKREKAGPVEYEYDVSGGAATKVSQLEATYAAAVKRYRRMV